MTKANCILPESMSEENLTDNDLFKIGPVGFVHLELLGIAEYWSAMAEDTNYTDKVLAKRISDRIVIRELHYSPGVSLQNARAVFDYLQGIRNSTAEESAAILASSDFLYLTNIDLGEEALAGKSGSIQGGLWYDAAERFPPGSELEGIIVNVVGHIGLFVEIVPGVTGLLHRSRLDGGVVDPAIHQVGGALKIRVMRVEPAERKMSLSVASRASSRRIN